MKSARFVCAFCGVLIAVTLFGALSAAAAGPGAPAAEAIGWRIGCQLWSFNKFTFTEAIDKAASIGLKYAEAFPGQRFSPDLPEDVKFEHSMSEETRQLAQKKLEAAGVKVVAYGVVGLPNNEEEARKVFEFAKTMGIEVITSEPTKKNLPLVDKLASEYGIKVAVHNHPKPSLYWDYNVAVEALQDSDAPDGFVDFWSDWDYNVAVEALQGLSPNVGVCADTGHWARSGQQPLDAVKALKGRLVSFHLKDLNAFGERDAHDVIWGTGVIDVKAILAEVYAQEAKPLFSIEYEHNWDNNAPDIAECVAYFDKVAAELSANAPAAK